MKRIAVSILNYRAAQDTIDCVRSLLRAQAAGTGHFELAIRVADNGSGQGDDERLREAFAAEERISLCANATNLGFAAGHNRNIEHLLAVGSPDFVWLLNNDCIVDEVAIDALLACSEARPEVGIWGASLLEPDGRTIQCAGGCRYRAWLSSFHPHAKGRSVDELAELPEPRLDYVAGASLFMTAATLEAGLAPPKTRTAASARWLNEEFFLYFEELDLARRLAPEYGLGWCRPAHVRHAGGRSTGAPAGRRAPRGEYHSTLSALKYTHLYEPGWLWITAPARFFVKGTLNLLGGRPDLFRALLKAYGDFFAWRRGETVPMRYR